MKDHVIILMAYLTNNRRGKQVDVHGRTYRSVYKKFGHQAMLDDYRGYNTWLVKR